jgi:3-oxoacyl-[acyl-carrier-protein] synthase-3
VSSFGIVAVEVVLGEPLSVAAAAPAYLADPGKIGDLGFRTFHRAPDDVGVTDLAAQAGCRALAAAGLPADEVDLVVLAMADVPEYLYWDAAAATQAKLGAHRAEAFLVNQACSSGVAAFDVVAGKFATHPEYRTALLVAANRVPEAYWNRMDSSTAITSDGAAAAVLVRGHGSGRWLATEVVSDGRYVDSAYLAVGGAARPFTPDGPAPGRMGHPVELMQQFLGNDLRAMIRFVRHNRDRNREVLDRACKRAGVRLDELDHILHMNAGTKAMADYAAQCGIPVERTNAAIALEHGHFGSADQLLSFAKLHADGRFRTGDLVALTSTGNGMHWACTLIRV